MELFQLRDVTDFLLKSDPLPTTIIHAAPVDPPPFKLVASPLSSGSSADIKPSIKAVNVQVTLGVKDQLIEDASNILSRASENIESIASGSRGRWEQAIRARSSHWGLLPQRPNIVPFSSRRVENTLPKNFLISYGLDDCSYLLLTASSFHPY